MSQDTLSLILKRTNAPIEPVFSYDEVRLWPDGEFELMVKLRLLREMAHAKSVECDGCEKGCIEDVDFIDGPGEGQVRAYVVCRNREDIGRVNVPLERLRRWQVNLPVIAHGLAHLVGFTHEVDEVIDGRLWYLGAPYVEGSRIDLFLARGLDWPDGEEVFRDVGKIQECAEPIILVPNDIPSPHPFINAGRILSLTRILYIKDKKIQLRMDELGTVADKARSKRTRIVESISVKPGTRWEDIFFTFPSDETVQITGPGINEGRSFATLGFQDMHDRSPDEGRPGVIWKLLLVFAKLGGAMTAQEARKFVSHDIGIVKKRISRLRAMLQAVFPGIKEGKPIGNYRTKEGWMAKINLIYSGEESL